MIKRIYFLLPALLVALSSCISNKQMLSAMEFSEKMKLFPTSPVIDVRTPEEFAKGHLPNAQNINWNGDDFEQQMASLPKTTPVFVYCLSGGRSASAVSKMRSEGFTEVYELEGGIMKWRAANLPETNNSSTTTQGMSKEQFDKLLTSNKLVLVDFYADWCAPCKKMKPSLEEITKEMADQVEVVRINADDNQALAKALNIDALPVLSLYKNKTLTWTNTGYMSKDDILRQLK